jgi:hypothetical protein
VFISRWRDEASLLVNAITPDQQPTTTPALVVTDGGSVTLLDLPALRARLTTLQQEADSKSSQSGSLQSLAQDRWRQLGELLLATRQKWTPQPDLVELVHQAEGLMERIHAEDSALRAVGSEERAGVARVFGRVSDWRKSRGITAQRTALETQLTPILIQIGHQAVTPSLPDANPIHAQASGAETEAMTLNSEAASATIAASSLSDEIQRRSESERELGFDAPYLAAHLQTYGAQHVDSPLILKKGEQASLAVAATLARQQTQQQWVGGSQGFSFPIGHTGIRYRVGSFRGHPIQQQFLGKLDTGTLVVTNQRIAFVGHQKSTSIPLAKLMHVECYSDAVAVFQEGRENPDFYLTAQPKYALFMINWSLGQSVS